MSKNQGTPGSSAPSSQRNAGAGPAAGEKPTPPASTPPPDAASEATAKPQGPPPEACFYPEDNHEITIHTFKLEEAIVIKNIGIKTFTPDPNTHSHIYRPMDEYGRKKEKCEPRLGHYHYVKVSWNPEATNPNNPNQKGWWVMECSQAKTLVGKKVWNESLQMNQNVDVEADLCEGDPRKKPELQTKPHTHTVTYHHSNRMQAKVPNAPKS